MGNISGEKFDEHSSISIVNSKMSFNALVKN